VTAAGFGAGAVLTVVPIAHMIAMEGAVVFVLAIFLRAPPYVMPARGKRVNVPQTKVDFLPSQTLRQPVFWVMYVAFVMVAAGGLMVAAQMAPIAHDFKIASLPVSLAGIQMAALTFAISLDRICDGFGRPFFGWISDHIGRENTMAIAFSISAALLFIVKVYGHNPTVFVLVTALFFGAFGEIYGLFPATCGDTFGVKYATTNAGMLYTAKGTASMLAPLANVLAATFGWSAVSIVAISLNLAAALLAFFVIKPMRLAFITRTEPAADITLQTPKAA
jgi:MFS transporter, OFA family, oxalate/formate antiporter